MHRLVSRRNWLRGAGVALSLPWLESLAPQLVKAQPASAPKRFLPIFLPNGAPELWTPANPGVGASWSVGPVLSPLEALKAKLTVITNLENGSAFNADGNPSVEPSHGRQPGAWLTCIDPGLVRERLGVNEANGISVDQLMAEHAAFKNLTPLASLQVGLSTVESYCDGQQCSNSRSVSWRTETLPLYKLVDPLEVFNKIVGVAQPTGPGGVPDAEAQKRLAFKKSVLDAVLENATRTRGQLSAQDQLRMDEFLDSVRSVENRVVQVSGGMGGLASCSPGAAPNLGTVGPNSFRQNTATYNKGAHADAMNELIVLALKCDVTRIISHMLEDERSEFTYDHVQKREFTATGSTPSGGTCPEYHGGGQHGSQNDFAAITLWNVGKVAELCSKLDEILEADGTTLLDNTVVLFGGAMHGSNHSCNELPTALIGSGGGILKNDLHVVLNNRPLRDLHFTLMNAVYGIGASDFGLNRTGAPISMIDEILAG